MLFKPQHREPICAKLKTETRRSKRKKMDKVKVVRTTTAHRPAVPGRVRGFYTRPAFVKNPGVPFCRAKILEVYEERLGDITLEGAIAEGYGSVEAYSVIWDEINGRGAWELDQDQLIWVVKFELVEQLTCARCGVGTDLATFVESVALFCGKCRGGFA